MKKLKEKANVKSRERKFACLPALGGNVSGGNGIALHVTVTFLWMRKGKR